MKKSIYRIGVYCGEKGRLDGLFIAEDDFINYIVEHEVPIYFGYNEVCKNMEAQEVVKVSNDNHLMDMFEKNNLQTGYNPLHESLASLELQSEEVSTINLSDWSVYDYVNYKINGILPNY